MIKGDELDMVTIESEEAIFDIIFQVVLGIVEVAAVFNRLFKANEFAST